jgi:hypothetical protein
LILESWIFIIFPSPSMERERVNKEIESPLTTLLSHEEERRNS